MQEKNRKEKKLTDEKRKEEIENAIKQKRRRFRN